ncbi:MAG: hypothetical protein IKU80_01735 [Firmicutes bacterium]|nr:hypothetical protein [Bacillota bacterium]
MVMRIAGSILKALFDGKCDIYRYEENKDEHGVTRLEMKKICEGEKCRVSFLKSGSAKESQSVTTAKQGIRIFLMKDCEIMSGDVLEIEQNGRKEKYRACGQIKVYGTHKEAELDIYDESI